MSPTSRPILRSCRRSCRKARRGARPVPAAIRINGVVVVRGSLKVERRRWERIRFGDEVVGEDGDEGDGASGRRVFVYVACRIDFPSDDKEVEEGRSERERRYVEVNPGMETAAFSGNAVLRTRTVSDIFLGETTLLLEME
jgi:hypothetical protein